MVSLTVHPEKCSGCRICEMACSGAHLGVFNPRKALLRIEIDRSPRLETELSRIDVPVVCLQCDPAPCAEACPVEARTLGAKVLVKMADVTNEDQVKGMVKEILSEFGKIDILVNNAFVMDRKVFCHSTREDWDKPINVCLYGTLICTRAVIDSMIARKYGKIINLISDAARVGEATSSVYAAAKGGIPSFSRSLAKEVGRYNINVNCVSPGATWTERRIREHQGEWEEASEEERERIKKREEKELRAYPLGRLGEPEDVANVIVFLASDRAKHITGEVISVNGGYAMV